MEAREILRGSGILLSIASLPSPYGIGTLGREAYNFVDLLVDLKQRYWQVLPIGPTIYGDSPYQPMSGCAGNIYFIDLDKLVDEGLLKREEILGYNWGADESEIDYAELYQNRCKILQKAFQRFDTNAQGFQDFVTKHSEWLGKYALYMALKTDNLDKNWCEWPEQYKNLQPVALANYRKQHYNIISFWEFCQYKFFEQWHELKNYANSKGVQIIGDISFYVGYDSVDVWSERNLFLMCANDKPSYVAAAGPDKYSDSGQIWGNPIYDWDRMKDDDFSWWRRRMRVSRDLFDIVRIDHFAGIVKAYAVPYGQDKTTSGKWIKGPGRKFINAINEELQGVNVIADDYTSASLLPGVKKLLAKSGWMGTKVMMFAFDGDPTNEYLPHNYTDPHVVAYIGTHDNETIVGSFSEKTDYELAYLYEYLNIENKAQIPNALIRALYQSTADLAIIQMQDILELGNEARMNYPSTVGHNWRWRLTSKPQRLSDEKRAWIRNIAVVYRR